MDDAVVERLTDIKEHPERHRHDFGGLAACSIVNGVRHIDIVDAHESVLGRTNGGVRCDVTSGPCACGAWH